MSGQLEFGEEDRSATLRRAWELSLHLLATKVSKVTFETYIRPAQPLSYVENVVTLVVSSPFARSVPDTASHLPGPSDGVCCQAPV